MQAPPYSQDTQKFLSAQPVSGPYTANNFQSQRPLIIAAPTNQCPRQQEKKSSWRCTAFLVLTLALLYGVYSCYNLKTTMSHQDTKIAALFKKASSLETRIPSDGSSTGYKSNQKTTQLFSSVGAGVSGIEVTCNGTDVCQSTSSSQTQVSNSLYEINQLGSTIYQLQQMVNRQGAEIEDLQNNTNHNPNVTGIHFVRSIHVTGNASFSSNIIELQDGRIATGQFGHSYWNDSVSILIYNMTTGALSANLTAPNTVSWFCQQIYQLQDGRLLSSVFDIHQQGVSLLHVWNVTTGQLIQTINTGDRAIHSIFQLHNGIISTLDFSGQLNAFHENNLENPFMQIPGVSQFIPDTYASQVEIIQQRVAYLFVIYNADSLIIINTDQWQIEGFLEVNSTTIDSALKSIFQTGPYQISAYSDDNLNPIIINLQNYIPSYVIDSPSSAIGIFSHGILVSASIEEPILSLWNPVNGDFLRFINQGVPFFAAHIINIDGPYNGFAVGSGSQGMISIYSY